MKKIFLTLVSGFVGLFCLMELYSQTTSVGAKPSEPPTYEAVYCARIAADISKFTGLSKRMDQKDYETVQTLMLLFLKQDLSIIESKTNHLWSDEEQKSIDLAKDYIERAKGKKQ
jgi:hypothetical protein